MPHLIFLKVDSKLLFFVCHREVKKVKETKKLFDRISDDRDK